MEDCSRRAMMKMSLATLAGVSCALPEWFHPQAAAQRPEVLNWDQFLSTIHDLAAAQNRANWNEDRYVAEAARVLTTLDLRDPNLLRAFEDYTDHHRGFPEIEAIHRERWFQISLLEFEPDEAIAHHDHPTMTGVLLCASGSLNVQNFDPRTIDDQLALQRVANETMRPGQVSTLTSRKRNIHRVQAGNAFTRVIDIFAPPYNRERSRRTRWFDVDPEPLPGHPDCFAAR